MLGENKNNKKTSQKHIPRSRGQSQGLEYWSPAHSTLRESCTVLQKNHRKITPKERKRKEKNRNKQQLPVIGTALLKRALEWAPLTSLISKGSFPPALR